MLSHFCHTLCLLNSPTMLKTYWIKQVCKSMALLIIHFNFTYLLLQMNFTHSWRNYNKHSSFCLQHWKKKFFYKLYPRISTFFKNSTIFIIPWFVILKHNDFDGFKFVTFDLYLLGFKDQKICSLISSRFCTFYIVWQYKQSVSFFPIPH